MFTFLFHLQVLAQGLFVLAVAIGMLLRRGGQLSFAQVHHAYWGALLYVAGLLLEIAQQRALALPVETLALAVTWDDAGEHWVQLALRQPDYAAPLKALFYGTLAALKGLFAPPAAAPPAAPSAAPKP